MIDDLVTEKRMLSYINHNLLHLCRLLGWLNAGVWGTFAFLITSHLTGAN